MKNSNDPEVPISTPEAEERNRRRNTGCAIAFGVTMATIQMGILLWFMYC